MNKNIIIDNDPDTSSSRKEDREIQLQDWNQNKGLEVAKEIGLEMTDEHWAVVDYLRERYLEQGDSERAREVAKELESVFSEKGGGKFLRKLFSGGPVTQGSKVAGLPVPAYSQDMSFGTTY